MKTNRGDTIVEVLFAMVVIGVSLAAAFGIANRSIQISRSSQERTEAQKIAESQIELIKAAISTEDTGGGNANSIKNRITNPSADNFCLYRGQDNQVSIDNSRSDNTNCDNITQLDSGVTYSVDIETETDGGNVVEYKVTVNWDRIGTNSDEPGVLTMYYRPGVIALNCSNGNPQRDLTEYALRNDVSGGDLRNAKDVVDVSVGGGGTSRSNPDIVLSQDLNTSANCNYAMEYVVYCTINRASNFSLDLPNQNPDEFGEAPTRWTSGGSSRPPCGSGRSVSAQRDERIIINFHVGYNGNRNNAQCQGNPIATLTTGNAGDDGLRGVNGVTYSESDASLQILTRNRNANCIELVHFCDENPLSGSCDDSGNSVLLKMIDWRVV